MKVLAFMFCFVFSSAAFAQQVVSTEEKLAYFLEITDTVREKGNNPGLAMAIFYDQKLIYQGTRGQRDIDKNLPVTSNTLFEVGSLTKAFTAALNARLVEEGKMDWNEAVRTYLPEFRLQDAYASEHTTLKDVFSHSSGLASHYYLMFGPDYSRNEILDLLPHMGFEDSFREAFHYNNFLYSVAGIAQERVTGKSWENLLEEKILEPLQMNHTLPNLDQIQAAENRTMGYKNDGQTAVTSAISNAFGPGGSLMVSDIEDMSRWLELFVKGGKIDGEEFFSPEQFKYLTTPHTVRNASQDRFYGMGWDVQFKEGRKLIFHDGRTNGQSSRLLLAPQQGFGIVILSNQAGDLQNLLTHYAENIFLNNKLQRNPEGEEYIAKRARKKAADAVQTYSIDDKELLNRLPEFTGVYKHPAYGNIQLTQNTKKELGFQYYQFKGTVEHHELLSFTAHTEHVSGSDQFDFQFVTDMQGNITALEIAIPYSPLLRFEKQMIE